MPVESGEGDAAPSEHGVRELASPVFTRMTTVESFLISPISPNSTLLLKPLMKVVCKLALDKNPALKRGNRKKRMDPRRIPPQATVRVARVSAR